MTDNTIAVFGASGAIGKAICKWFLKQECRVIAISRSGACPCGSLDKADWISWDGESGDLTLPNLNKSTLSAVVWAQGENLNDNIYTFDLLKHQSIYAANVTYILMGLQYLLKKELLAPKARLCVISSIWQNIAKQNKLSYCVTKSALQGLVQSLSIDLGHAGYMINAVLPGALDTPMTRANLNSEQIERLEKMSPLVSLPELADVCNLVGFLCSDSNTGITGQFIAADRGFSNARII